MDDDIAVLELYFKENNRAKMNRLMDEYKNKLHKEEANEVYRN